MAFFTNGQMEILAPAGSWEQLKAAVNNGCNSVYLGLDSFNARMKAPNFTCDNIAQVVDYCHLLGVKVYVTVNTSVKNAEFDQAVETLFAAYKANTDGVIVTDLKLLQIAGKLKGNFDVVASTQLNCHDKYGAQFLKDLGATTVVCARECSLQQIREIASVGVKVETFVHGALCVCQSGQCLFSSLVGGNSGNRGLCAQPCRNFYTANTAESGYLLSTSDLDGTKEAQDLVDAGASVFKIEGRNRSAEYAGVCSRAFRQLFDNGQIDQQTKLDLQEVYSRGNMGYLPYLEGNNGGVIYKLHPRHVGRKVGVVKNGTICADMQIVKGDGFKIFDKKGNEVCGAVAQNSGMVVDASFSTKVTDGMTVCRTSSVALHDSVVATKKTLDVSFCFTARKEQFAKLVAKCGDVIVSVVSAQQVQLARNAATTTDEIVKQLSKTGDSYATICDIVVEKDDVFLAKSQLNALRRDALDKLQHALQYNANQSFVERQSVTLADLQTQTQSKVAQPKQNAVAVTCNSAEQVAAAYECGATCVVYKPQNISAKSLEAVGDTFVYLDLPSFADLDYVAKLLEGKVNIGIVCHNVGHIQFCRQLGLHYVLGRGLNVFNDYFLDLFVDRDGFVFSYELSLAETNAFANKDGFVFVDGCYPLMQLVHCPYKVAAKSSCQHCVADNKLCYTDEKGNSFTIQRRKDAKCSFELFNGLRLSALGKVKLPDRYLVDFDKDVVAHYVQLNNGIDDGYRFDTVATKGRLFNKIN